MDGWLDALGVDGPTVSAGKTRAFYRIFYAGMACEFWFESSIRVMLDEPAWTLVASSLLFTATTVWVWCSRALRWPTVVGLVLLAVRFAPHFPLNANHHYVTFFVAALPLLLRSEDDDERGLLLAALRWMFFGVLFHSGLQKLGHLLYFKGQQLAMLVAYNDRFAGVFRFLIPDDEYARLRALGNDVGAGPFEVKGFLFTAVSNLTYLAEMGLPVAMLFPRLRPWAIAGSIVLVFAIEAGAKELFFGIMMVNGLLLFAERDRNTQSLWLFMALIAYLMAMIMGLLPRWRFM